MESPLKYDEAVKKEFGILDEFELDNDQRLGFVRNQYDEIRKFLQRERVELILAEAQTKTEIEAVAAEARSKVASHRNTIKGIVASLTVLKKLVDELSPPSAG